jgi:hypothetical protein
MQIYRLHYPGPGVLKKLMMVCFRESCDIFGQLSNGKCFCSRHLVIFPYGSTAISRPGPPHYRGFTITLGHTTLGRTPLYEWSARRRDPTSQHTTITGDRYKTPRRNSNLQSQKASDRPREYWGRQFSQLNCPNNFHRFKFLIGHTTQP